MTNELIINNQDAYLVWGVNMESSFLSELLTPAPMKDYIENESRLEHGKRVIVSSPKVQSRTLTLTFRIIGNTESEFKSRYSSFVAALQSGVITLKVPKLGNETYKLLYKKSTSFALNLLRTTCKLSVSFEEPNPNDRS